ncbi:MAG: hypothetical protein MK193_13415 [Lentisphaeria bacterium]|nr:hypothetical protein [Lentisphaeria bacterium]
MISTPTIDRIANEGTNFTDAPECLYENSPFTDIYRHGEAEATTVALKQGRVLGLKKIYYFGGN